MILIQSKRQNETFISFYPSRWKWWINWSTRPLEMGTEIFPLPIQIKIILQDFDDQLTLTRKFNENNPTINKQITCLILVGQHVLRGSTVWSKWWCLWITRVLNRSEQNPSKIRRFKYCRSGVWMNKATNWSIKSHENWYKPV